MRPGPVRRWRLWQPRSPVGTPVVDAASAAAVVFVAELGDKTQLVAAGFGARWPARSVLAGVVAGYAAVNAVSVALGAAAGAALPVGTVSLIGGVIFLAFAAWTALAGDGAADEVGPAPAAAGTLRIIAVVAGAMFVAELGDKTMLATATLAARASPVPVWIGATAGISLAGAVGVLGGRWVGSRIPPEVLRWISAGLFAAFGVALIVAAL